MTKACKENQNVSFKEDKKLNIAEFHIGYTPGQEKYINVCDSPALDIS